MLTNAALILALVTTAVTSAAATSSAAYVAPTVLPSGLGMEPWALQRDRVPRVDRA